MATATTRKVRVVRKPAKSTTRQPRDARKAYVDTPMNVKVRGERAMRKNVILTLHPTDKNLLVVHTGRRGRPGHIALDQIEKVRAL